MAKANSTGAPPPDKKADALADASVYGLRRDALMIVSSLHRGREFPPMNLFAAQLVFVQGQLCRAALADPRLTPGVKSALIDFHGATVRESISERRGKRGRADTVTAPVKAG